MSKKKSAVEDEVHMDMTPMIDVTFQLLIFFIITLKFKLLEKKLNSHLPTDFGSQLNDMPIDEMFTTIRLRQSKDSDLASRDRPTEVFLENEKMTGAYLAEQRSKLKTRLSQFIKVQKDAKGKIDVGPGVPHFEVVAILDLFNQCGYKTVSFVGMPKSRSIADAQAWWKKTRAILGDN
ncbi:MAG: biopolymer transport protein ExbD [Planctomycetota bacterium]|jgi:biopolymer transport protein ExbD